MTQINGGLVQRAPPALAPTAGDRARSPPGFGAAHSAHRENARRHR